MFIYLLCIIFLLLFVHLTFNYNRKARLLRKVPGPKLNFIIGNALEIIIPRAQLFKFLRDFAKAWGTIWRLWSYPLGAVCIFHPNDVEIVLSGLKHNKKSIFYNFLKPWLQEGLLVSEGRRELRRSIARLPAKPVLDEVKGHRGYHKDLLSDLNRFQVLNGRRRKILTPAFHFNILRRFCTTFEENSQRVIKILEKSEGSSVNVVEIISEFTLHTICETAMGTQLDKDTGKSYKDAIRGLGDLIVHRVTRTYLYLDFMFYMSAVGNLEKKYLNTIHNFTTKVINFRRNFLSTHGNNINEIIEDDDDKICYRKRKTAMLDLLISAEKDGLIDAKGIQEEVDTFMFEAHDTTSSGLTYFLVALANYKIIQDKIVDELKDIFGESKRRATIEDLAKMRYLERCIKEALRLYPPVPLIGRILSEEIKLGGYTIPAGTYCVIHIFDLHRCEQVYKDPLVFDPDRFLPENCVSRHPYAYIPFSAGPRNCIGQKFAMLEMKSVVSEILRKFVLLPRTKVEDLDFTADLVLRTAVPVYVEFAKRTDSF